MKNIMKTVATAVFTSAVLGFSTSSFAAGGGSENLDEVYLNVNDVESLRNGAKIFANNCLSCHSAQYARYNRVAKDLGIPIDAVEGTLMFASEKAGDRMVAAMSPEDAKKWFGIVPPDLTLISRVKKPNWVYTYLRSFYKDESSVTGWNNALVQNVSMPHVMWEMQGSPELISLPDAKGAGSENPDAEKKESHDGEAQADEKVYVAGGAKFDMSNRGALSNAEFDKAMRDVTNYLAYLAEPAQLQRKTIGVWTMLFLVILLLLTYLLKKEFWRDVH